MVATTACGAEARSVPPLSEATKARLAETRRAAEAAVYPRPALLGETVDGKAGEEYAKAFAVVAALELSGEQHEAFKDVVASPGLWDHRPAVAAWVVGDAAADIAASVLAGARRSDGRWPGRIGSIDEGLSTEGLRAGRSVLLSAIGTARAGDLARAQALAFAALQLAGDQSRGMGMVGMMMAAAQTEFTLVTLEWLLARPGLSDADLVRAMVALESFERGLPTWEQVLHGERVFLASFSEADFAAADPVPSAYSTRDEHIAALELMWLELGRDLDLLHSAPLNARLVAVTAHSLRSVHAGDLSASGLQRGVRRREEVRAQLVALRVRLACELHRRRTGSWPASLEALVPATLASLPPDPMTAKPFVYSVLPDGSGITIGARRFPPGSPIQ